MDLIDVLTKTTTNNIEITNNHTKIEPNELTSANDFRVFSKQQQEDKYQKMQCSTWDSICPKCHTIVYSNQTCLCGCCGPAFTI